MMNFKQWLYEDVTNQRDAFTQLFQSTFPNAKISADGNQIKAVAPLAGRNVVALWVPGMDRKRAGDPQTENNSYIKLDFFHLDNKGTEDDPDYVGQISQGQMTPNTIDFTKVLLRFTKGIKNLGIHILFDAVGPDRSLSYASLLQKMGFQLGWSLGHKQMWLAHPVEGYETQMPDLNKARQEKMARKFQPQTTQPTQPGIRINMN